MIVLVNPLSSGVELAQAFHEQGVKCVHVYSRDFMDEYQAESLVSDKILHEDMDATHSELERLGPSAVVAASEFGVLLADELAARLRLPGHAPETSTSRRNKLMMIRELERAGVPAPMTTTVSSMQELAQALARQRFPVMVKPTDSAGSDGCRICHTADETTAAFNKIINRRNLMAMPNDEVVLQEYLDGDQYIVNSVSVEGRHLLTEFYSTRVDATPEGAPVYRHILSHRTLTAVDTEVVDYVFTCLDALGVREGAAHTEVRLTTRGPRLVEVNSRVMGPCLLPDSYFAAFGYSHQHLVVESHVRRETFTRRFDIPYGPRQHLAKIFLRSNREGIVHGVPGLEVLRRLPGFHSVARLAEIGKPIRDRLLTTGASGIAFLVHPDRALLESSLMVVHELEDAGQFYDVRSETY